MFGYLSRGFSPQLRRALIPQPLLPCAVEGAYDETVGLGYMPVILSGAKDRSSPAQHDVVMENRATPN
jgi:hypothetical protein